MLIQVALLTRATTLELANVANVHNVLLSYT
jgi:hypothetical protein